VELVDDDYRPVAPGARASRILLTNLYNRVQPLIRYEMNDAFSEAANANSGFLAARVEGRADDVLRYEDAEVHPLVIRSVLLSWPEVTDYRVEQTERGVNVALESCGPVECEQLREELAGAMQRSGLARPEVAVQRVEQLPRSVDTGKLRRFVPLERTPGPAPTRR
jgi:phenylacetate-coenzyme A ligase PaaK-like adenylate-forming protein